MGRSRSSCSVEAWWATARIRAAVAACCCWVRRLLRPRARCGHGGVGLEAQIWALSGLTWVGGPRSGGLATATGRPRGGGGVRRDGSFWPWRRGLPGPILGPNRTSRWWRWCWRVGGSRCGGAVGR
jgi:hypothetical protein